MLRTQKNRAVAVSASGFRLLNLTADVRQWGHFSRKGGGVQVKILLALLYLFRYSLLMTTKPILTVHFFRTDAGNEPVREFLRDLTAEDRRRAGEDIKTAQFGWPVGMPLIRKLAAGLWEVRSDINDGIVRVMFTVNGSQMVLLHAFVKKSQKTPAADLETAKKRLKQLKG